MFLLCLFAAYLIVRLWEDTTATIRREPPPRHAYRMAKLAARGDAGRPVPTGAFRRYATGLLDDAWDSAHHRRELLAEHRADKRARKAKAKIAKERAAWAREDGVAPDPVGFDAVVPEAPTLSTPAAPPLASAGPGGPATPDSAATSTTPSTDGEPTTVSEPAGPSPASAPPADRFSWTAIAPATSTLASNAGVPAAGKPSGKATKELANRLRQRMELVPDETIKQGYEALINAGELTNEQFELARRWQDGLATGKTTWSMSTQEWRSLPLPVRVDLLDEIRRHPNASIVTSPGEEDVEALAALAERHGGSLDPASIYSALDDLSPETQERIRQTEAEFNARRTAAANGDAANTDAASGDASSTPQNTATPEPEESTEPSNVIPIRRPQPTTSTTPAVATATPTRMELPMTSTEITGLDSAIKYAEEMQAFCQGTFEQIREAVPSGDQAAASCEQAHANLVAGDVTGKALTDVASVQEQVVGAARALEAALAKYEQAAASAASLKAELESHRTVQDAYNATPDAGNKEFVTTH